MSNRIKDYLFRTRRFWVSTPELAQMFAADRPNARQQVWVIMRRLESYGIVEREKRENATYWKYKS